MSDKPYQKPLSEEVNALPERIRQYIHDLETSCDPSGYVQTIACQRDQIEALLKQVEELRNQ